MHARMAVRLRLGLGLLVGCVMTLALADASDIPVVPAWVWVTLAALALACVVLALAARHAPGQEPETSRLDRADGLTEGQPACHSPGPRGGHYVKAAGAWWACEACGETWRRDAPYDQEASA